MTSTRQKIVCIIVLILNMVSVYSSSVINSSNQVSVITNKIKVNHYGYKLKSVLNDPTDMIIFMNQDTHNDIKIKTAKAINAWLTSNRSNHSILTHTASYQSTNTNSTTPYSFTAKIDLPKPSKNKSRIIKVKWEIDINAYNEILNKKSKKRKQVSGPLGLECTYVLPKTNRRR
jgi:hypothetical protein